MLPRKGLRMKRLAISAFRIAQLDGCALTFYTPLATQMLTVNPTQLPRCKVATNSQRQKRRGELVKINFKCKYSSLKTEIE